MQHFHQPPKKKQLKKIIQPTMEAKPREKNSLSDKEQET